jgi:hypothetical protein
VGLGQLAQLRQVDHRTDRIGRRLGVQQLRVGLDRIPFIIKIINN